MTSDAVDQSADNRDGSSTSRSETTSPVVAASIAAQLKTLGHASAQSGPPPPGSNTHPVQPGDIMDRAFRYQLSRVTAGLSPFALAEAYFDWLLHLIGSPGRQSELLQKWITDSIKVSQHVAQCSLHGADGTHAPCAAPHPYDKRFTSDAWHTFPFSAIHQSFLLTEQWWHMATTGIRGVSEHHARVMEFATRQILDVFSPSNFLLTNPDALKRTQLEGGQNLVRGFLNAFDDAQRTFNKQRPAGVDAFQVGRDVAITPGKVIYRNNLIELIQYEPTTQQVKPQPLLFVPAWIMKYYILDLSPENSLVRYMVDQGFTVFMISWKNPQAEDRFLGFDEYLRLGVMSALNAINEVVPNEKIHACGYCLGGTLLSMAAAAMARDRDDRLASLTFLAAQTDFTEAGELTLFTSESQIAFLEDMMWEQGYLDSTHMAGAFQMLRSSDLIWSRMVRHYLMGEHQTVNDLMAWNADATRMPYRMHSQYLRQLFLRNDLAEGRFHVDGRSVALRDNKQPIFFVCTETDHVAPLRSVYKFNLLTDAEVTSLLTSGGHNAGIISEPGHKGRHYRASTKRHTDSFIDPDTWASQTPATEGSWWPQWAKWLTAKSAAPVAPPPLGHGPDRLLLNAPGSYVLQT